MATSVTFETATLVDAIKRAARVAPSKSGNAFDKAAGIVLDIFPDEEAKCVLRATDTSVFLAEILGVLEATGKEIRWRLPSMVLASVIGSLPITSGKQVKFSQGDGEDKIKIESGRLRATLVLMDPTYYPDWDMFDPDKLEAVSGLGGKLAQVEWASDTKGQPPLSGVHLTGTEAIATDRYRMARVPCRVALNSGVTIPAGILGDVLRPMGDVRIGVNGSLLQIAVDEYTQIQTVIYDTLYPSQVQKVMRTDYPQKVRLHKNTFLEMINRATQFSGADRSPTLKMFIGKEEVAIMMANAEVGLLGDVVECPGSALHKRIQFNFNPKYISDSLGHCPNDTVEIGYDPEETLRPFYLDGGSGFEAWILPRKEMKPEM